jgi:hypothetical protein
MILRSPAIPGQTAQFEMTHPAGAAGNAYTFLASMPPYAPTTVVTVPGLTVQGLARVNPQTFFATYSGVLGASGSVVHNLPIPTNPSYLGFDFDLQSIDWSLANSTLAFADNDITVTVRAQQWQTPTILSTSSLSGGQPRIAVHPQGTATALWVLTGAAGATVQASSYQPGSGWSAPVPVSTSGTATELAMGMDQAGNVVAVWKEVATDSIWSSRRDALGWSTPVLLESGGGWAGNPQVAVDAVGNAIAVWWQYEGIYNTGARSIFANHFTPGTGWGGAFAIENDSQSFGEAPQIACDGLGNATAVWRWQDQNPPYPATVWSNRYTAGSGWGTAGPVTADIDVSPNTPPEVAVDANGNAIAIWEAMGTSYREIHVSRRTGSGAGTWGPTLRLDPTTTITSDTPKVAMLGSGNAIAVWSEHDGTRFHVMQSTFDVSTGWSPAAIAASTAGSHCRSPQVAVDGLGAVVITWLRSGAVNTCWSSRLPAGGTWSAPVQIDDNNHGGVAGSHVGVDASGNAIAVIEVYQPFVPANALQVNEYR